MSTALRACGLKFTVFTSLSDLHILQNFGRIAYEHRSNVFFENSVLEYKFSQQLPSICSIIVSNSAFITNTLDCLRRLARMVQAALRPKTVRTSRLSQNPAGVDWMIEIKATDSKQAEIGLSRKMR